MNYAGTSEIMFWTQGLHTPPSQAAGISVPIGALIHTYFALLMSEKLTSLYWLLYYFALVLSTEH